jgi:hypothetical protein
LSSSATVMPSLRWVAAFWSTEPTSGQSERRNGARSISTSDSCGVLHAGDGEGPGHGMAEGVGHRARHRRAGGGGEMGIDRPQLDPVALAMEPHQVGAHRGAAVEAELADSLSQLAHEQVIPVELGRGEGEVDSLALVVDGEDSPTASLPRITSANGFHGVSCAEANEAEPSSRVRTRARVAGERRRTKGGGARTGPPLSPEEPAGYGPDERPWVGKSHRARAKSGRDSSA